CESFVTSGLLLPSIPPTGPFAKLLSPSSVARDDDLAEMTTPLEMLVGLFGLAERECPIDHRMQAVHGDRPVHGLEIYAAADADRAERNAAVSNKGSSPAPDRVRLPPIRLMCPP